MFQYVTCCVHAQAEDLHPMIDTALEITWATFRKHVPVSEVQDVFPSYSYKRELHNPTTGEETCEFHIKDDYAVSFHRSRFKGQRCFYIRHSAIEYIFQDA